jgi:formylglycine-generating enzyme required for sulfatase activity
MGSEAGEENEQPVHEVTITKPFCLAERELTRKEWETIQGSAGLRTDWRGDSLPVSKVSYDEVQEFLGVLNEREGRPAFRLPTEAEWEYVASAPGATNGNCHGESEPVPVGSFPANSLGFYDLIGNVWEMTGDWYSPYPKVPVVDPKGPESGEERVVRGGSFESAEEHCRPTRRETRKPTSKYKNTGFRVLREIPHK